MYDNYDIWAMHDAEQEKALMRLPVCCKCDEHIQQEDAVRIDGNWYCDECLEGMREEVEEWN